MKCQDLATSLIVEMSGEPSDFACREKQSKRSKLQRKDNSHILKLKYLWDYEVVMPRTQLGQVLCQVWAQYELGRGSGGYPHMMLPRDCALHKRRNCLRVQPQRKQLFKSLEREKTSEELLEKQEDCLDMTLAFCTYVTASCPLPRCPSANTFDLLLS